MQNMVRIVFTFVILLGINCLSLAAEPAFIVFYNSGKAVKNVAGKASVLVKGELLFDKDLLTVPEKAQVVLVCSNYAVIQLKTKGVYRVSALLARCKQQQSSATSAYFNYVWHSFAHAHTEPAKDPRAYMKTYGAASRGRKFKLAVDTINYFNGKLSVGIVPSSVFMINVFDHKIDGKLMLTTKPSTALSIDSIALKLQKPGFYYWNFEAQPSPQRYVLKLWDAKAYQATVQQIVMNVVPAAAAEQAYLTAFTLEEKRFLVEAAKFYKKAFLLEPNNQIFKAAYERFMP